MPNTDNAIIALTCTQAYNRGDEPKGVTNDKRNNRPAASLGAHTRHAHDAVLRTHLEKYRARRDMVDACCADLGIGIGSFYRWCREYDIEVKDYHHLEPVNA